jgi:hypothetical protein
MGLTTHPRSSWAINLLDYSVLLVHLYQEVMMHLPRLAFLWSTMSSMVMMVTSLLVMVHLLRKVGSGQVSPLNNHIAHSQPELWMGRVLQQIGEHVFTICRSFAHLFSSPTPSPSTSTRSKANQFAHWGRSSPTRLDTKSKIGTGNVRLRYSPSNWMGWNAFWKWRRLKRQTQINSTFAFC